jgi:hypothetical protein
VLALVILSCVLLICVGCGGGGAGRDAPKIAPDTGIGVQYAEIKAKQAEMSEQDWKDYRNSLWKEEIQWIGWVNKVEGSGNNMWLKVDMNPPSNWDVALQIASENLLKLRPGTEVTFKGKIDEVRDAAEGDAASVKVWLMEASVVE